VIRSRTTGNFDLVAQARAQDLLGNNRCTTTPALTETDNGSQPCRVGATVGRRKLLDGTLHFLVYDIVLPGHILEPPAFKHKALLHKLSYVKIPCSIP
jgi:hypothetical protein